MNPEKEIEEIPISLTEEEIEIYESGKKEGIKLGEENKEKIWNDGFKKGKKQAIKENDKILELSEHGVRVLYDGKFDEITERKHKIPTAVYCCIEHYDNHFDNECVGCEKNEAIWCSKCDITGGKAKRQHERLRLIEEINYQVQKLNTLELKKKSPISWTKLQQFIEFLKSLEKGEGR